jgi:hypothetical protein
MKEEGLTFAGLTLGGVGLFLGMAMSSSITSTPFVYGAASAIYMATAAAIYAGVKRRRLNASSG